MDTRDMTADALTKGSVDRIAVHLLMSGEIKIVHEPKLWKSLCWVSPSEARSMKNHKTMLVASEERKPDLFPKQLKTEFIDVENNVSVSVFISMQ